MPDKVGRELEIPFSVKTQRRRQWLGALLFIQHLGDERNHQILLFRVAHGYQESEGGECVIRKFWLPISIEQQPIPCQKSDKECCSAPFIAVLERMVLHDKVKQVRSL